MKHARKLLLIYIINLVSSLLINLGNAEPHWTACYKGTNVTDHKTQFQENVNSVFSDLNIASSTVYFYNATVGSTPDQVFSMFLCRYDIPIHICSNCITNATAELLNTCPGFRQAVTFYRECTLHYANRPIFSRLQLSWLGFWCEEPHLSGTLFNNTVERTILGLIDNVTAAVDRHNHYYFATGETTYMVYQTLHSLVQCGPDITQSNCRKCLLEALNQALYYCGDSAGATLYFESCFVTYSFYALYNNSTGDHNVSMAPQPLVNSPSFPTGDGRNSSPKFGPDTLSLSIAFWIILFLMEMLPRLATGQP